MEKYFWKTNEENKHIEKTNMRNRGMSIETQLQATSMHCITLEHILIITYQGVNDKADLYTMENQNQLCTLTPHHKFLGIC